MVKVYSITTCPWCKKVKKYLKSKNVEFEEHNIELSEEDRDECYKISGDLIVPVTTVDGKDDFVVSFDKAKLDALLGL
jgi:glutaredoxin-like YruB-family protein